MLAWFGLMFECSSASGVIPSPLLLTLNAHLHRVHDPVSAFSVIFTVLTLTLSTLKAWHCSAAVVNFT